MNCMSTRWDTRRRKSPKHIARLLLVGSIACGCCLNGVVSALSSSNPPPFSNSNSNKDERKTFTNRYRVRPSGWPSSENSDAREYVVETFPENQKSPSFWPFGSKAQPVDMGTYRVSDIPGRNKNEFLVERVEENRVSDKNRVSRRDRDPKKEMPYDFPISQEEDGTGASATSGGPVQDIFPSMEEATKYRFPSQPNESFGQTYDRSIKNAFSRKRASSSPAPRTESNSLEATIDTWEDLKKAVREAKERVSGPGDSIGLTKTEQRRPSVNTVGSTTGRTKTPLTMKTESEKYLSSGTPKPSSTKKKDAPFLQQWFSSGDHKTPRPPDIPPTVDQLEIREIFGFVISGESKKQFVLVQSMGVGVVGGIFALLPVGCLEYGGLPDSIWQPLLIWTGLQAAIFANGYARLTSSAETTNIPTSPTFSKRILRSGWIGLCVFARAYIKDPNVWDFLVLSVTSTTPPILSVNTSAYYLYPFLESAILFGAEALALDACILWGWIDMRAIALANQNNRFKDQTKRR